MQFSGKQDTDCFHVCKGFAPKAARSSLMALLAYVFIPVTCFWDSLPEKSKTKRAQCGIFHCPFVDVCLRTVLRRSTVGKRREFAAPALF
jgi:hypothetical protein